MLETGEPARDPTPQADGQILQERLGPKVTHRDHHAILHRSDGSVAQWRQQGQEFAIAGCRQRAAAHRHDDFRRAERLCRLRHVEDALDRVLIWNPDIQVIESDPMPTQCVQQAIFELGDKGLILDRVGAHDFTSGRKRH